MKRFVTSMVPGLLGMGVLAGGTPAVAGVPAQAWLGVERVVLDCTVDGPLSVADRAALCAQMLEQARAMSSMPVRATGDAPIDERDLIVAVTLSAKDAKPRAMGMSVAVSRAGLAKADGPRTRSVPVAISWTGGAAELGERALPLQVILGSGAPMRAGPGVMDRR